MPIRRVDFFAVVRCHPVPSRGFTLGSSLLSRGRASAAPRLLLAVTPCAHYPRCHLQERPQAGPMQQKCPVWWDRSGEAGSEGKAQAGGEKLAWWSVGCESVQGGSTVCKAGLTSTVTVTTAPVDQHLGNDHVPLPVGCFLGWFARQMEGHGMEEDTPKRRYPATSGSCLSTQPSGPGAHWRWCSPGEGASRMDVAPDGDSRHRGSVARAL